MKLTWTAMIAVATSAACSPEAPTVRQVQPQVLEVMTAPGVALEVLDWEGSGQPPLVFLAGGGHTAHEFDEFAPLLADDFRVIGITRRGIGASAEAAPEDIRDHVNDIVAVLDALEFDSVVLVGHSFAGLEMALFGERYDDRCSGLVYLDSAYDYTDPELRDVLQTTPPPEGPAMTRADSASVDAIRAFSERTQGFSVPGSEIRATRQFDDRGRMTRTAPNVATRVEPRAPRWASVACPGLGLYAVPAPLETWMPWYAARYDSLDAAERERAEAYVRAFGAWTAKHREAFGRLRQNRVIEFPRTGHYFFLEKPQEAAAAIRDFAAGLR